MDSSDNRFYREKPRHQQQVMIDYTNHAGVRAVRQIAPISWRFGATEWHPEPQWLLDAYDLRKDDVRTFAVKDIHKWSPSPISGVDASIAKQLQASMELNARMKARLLRVRANMRAHQPDGSDIGWTVAIAADEALEDILQDRDPPAWPIV